MQSTGTAALFGVNPALRRTAPSWRFPLIANAWDAAAHVVYGTALGLLLAAGKDSR